MVRSASCASRTMRPRFRPRPSFETRAMRAPQDEDVFLGVFFFLFAADFLATGFAGLRAFGRLPRAARCAAANAALAQPVSSSGSSKSRAGNCQYELTVTVLARVWY